MHMQFNTLQHLAPISLAILLLTQSCSEKKVKPAEERFVITDSLINRLQLDTVKQADHTTDLILSAKITENQDQKSEIFPMVSGYMVQVYAKIGDRVIKGQTMAVLNSAEMAGYSKEVNVAKAEMQIAERNLTQAQALFDGGLTSAKELAEARGDYEIKKAEQKRAMGMLSLNGGSNNGLYAIKSPVSGFVIEKNVNQNMQIRTDYEKSLFTVADLNTVWAMVNVYESDIARLQEGDPVEISVLAYPEKTFNGKIDKLYNLIDQETKVMNARVSINNPNFSLKPGMLATVKVAASRGINLPLVKSRAIIFDDNKNYVLVVDPSKKVRIQQVEISRKTADNTYISKGLQPGDQVISSRQVFLYESLKK